MIEDEIISGNKLIAEFMGGKKSDFGDYMVFTVDNPQYTGKINHNQIFYHSSWDWLMPVVEKIENMDCVASLSIDFHNCCIFKRNDGTRIDQISNQTNNKIEAVYKTVVEFIKWYKLTNVAK